jgi:hypothetical protein
MSDTEFLERARENGPELYACLSKCFRAYKNRVPVGSDAMVDVMKVLDKTDGGNRFSAAKEAQSGERGKSSTRLERREEHEQIIK